MAIRHANVATSSSTGTSAHWNADHVVDDASKPKNSTTLIVAAHDSIDTTRADYVCDGVADEVEINAAITALGGQGGQITLLEGSYVISGYIDLTSGVTIRGQGYGTQIQTTANISMIRVASCAYVILQDMRITGAGAGHNSNHGVTVSASGNISLHNLLITDCGGSGIDVTGTSDDVQITQCFSSANVGYGINLHGASTNVIVFGNHCGANGQNGIYLFKVVESVISSNISENNTQSGIVLIQSTDNTVIGNIAEGNDSGATGFYDGIRVMDFSDYNTLTGNRCKNNGRYGLNIDTADCDYNIVVANNLHAGGTTGNYNDSGTNTEAGHNVTA